MKIVIIGLALLGAIGCTTMNERNVRGCYDATISYRGTRVLIEGDGVVMTGDMTTEDCAAIRVLRMNQ